MRRIQFRTVALVIALVATAGGFLSSAYSEEQRMNDRTPLERYVTAERYDEMRAAQRDYVEFLLQKHGPPPERAVHGDPFRGGPASSLRTGRLLREWNPIGFSAEDARKLMGDPWKQTDSKMTYAYSVGMAAVAWEFGIDERGMIDSLRRIPGA